MSAGRLCAAACGAALALSCAGKDGSDGKTGSNGADGDAGSQGPPGTGAGASINGVMPSSGFLGGHHEITLSGFATSWDAQSVVDFGQGVSVSRTTVASPTALVVAIRVDFDALTGPRDVSVTTGGEKLTYAAAFHLDSPLSVRTQGSAAQGSIVLATLQSRDFSRPFDTTAEGDGFFMPYTYPNIAVAGDPGLLPQVNGVTPYSVEIGTTVDVMFTPGPAQLSVLSGPVGARESFPAPGALEIAARTPEVLASGAPATTTIAKAFDSALYQFDVGGKKIVEAVAAPGDASASPNLYLLPSNGKFSEIIDVGTELGLVASSTTPLYLVYWDNSGASAYDVVVDLRTYTAVAANEAEPNDASATARVAPSLPFIQEAGTLSTGSDVDWIAVPIAAGDVGKKIVARTYAGDPNTDTVLDLVAPDGTTVLAGPTATPTYHDALVSDPTTQSGTHYLRVAAGSYYDAAHVSYGVYVRLE